MIKRVPIFVVCLLLVSIVIALPPPPPTPAGFGSDGSSDSGSSKELPPTTASSSEVNDQVAGTQDSNLAERVAVLENKNPSILILISLALDVILLVAVIYLLLRKPKLPEYQQSLAQQNHQQ